MTVGVEISKRLVLINSIGSVVARGLNVSVLVWLNQYLLSRISKEEFSLYPVVMAVMTVVPLLTSVLTSGVGRYIIEAYAQGDERRITQIVSTMLPVTLLASCVVLAGGWWFAWNVSLVLNIPPDRVRDARIMLFLLMFTAAVDIPMLLLTCGLYVRQKFILQNLIYVGCDLLRIVLLFALLLGVSTRVLWVVVATVAAQCVRTSICFVISRRLMPAIRFVRSEFRRAYIKQVTSFGAWAFIADVAEVIRTSSTPFVLNRLATAADLTCYYLGSLVQGQVQAMAIVASAPLQPALTAMHATNRKDQLSNAYLRGGRYALWMVMFVAAPMIIFRKEVITLYVGESFLLSATVMALLLLTFPIGYGHVMLVRIAHATANVGPVARRVLFHQLVSLGLMLYLVGVQKMGATGAAWSILLCAAVLSPILLWPLGFKLAAVSFSTWLRQTLWPGLLPCLCAVPVWLILKQWVPLTSWMNLGLVTAAGLLVYVAVLLVFCLQPYERSDLRRIQQAILRKLGMASPHERKIGA